MQAFLDIKAWPDAPKVLASLHEAGVIVRELPGRNLVRASWGWWTNDDALQRLAAGVA